MKTQERIIEGRSQQKFKMKSTIIGLSGLAGAGKDLFFSILSQKVNCKRFALADELKRETKPILLENYGIDPTTCSREEKEKIRDFLVFHGSFRRDETDGRYWIDKLTPSLKNHSGGYAVVTDVRYDEHPLDEVHWLKNEMKGVLVHISRFTEVPYANVPNIKQRAFIEPPNEKERINDPILKEKSDYQFAWPTTLGHEKYVNTKLSKHVDKFLAWLEKDLEFRRYRDDLPNE